MSLLKRTRDPARSALFEPDPATAKPKRRRAHKARDVSDDLELGAAPASTVKFWSAPRHASGPRAPRRASQRRAGGSRGGGAARRRRPRPLRRAPRAGAVETRFRARRGAADAARARAAPPTAASPPRVASMASTRCRGRVDGVERRRVTATPSTRPAREAVVAATPRAGPSRYHVAGNAFRKISALAAPVAIPKQQGLTRQQALGRLGGKCAGSIGENKFAVEVAADGRSRCQLRTCKVPLKIGELRLGKRPPSLRHGQNKKCTWYHPECAMVAFAACSKKSRVVERVEDIDYGFESLSAKDQQRIRKAIANRPVDKSVVQRKPSSKPRKCHKVPIVHAIDTDTSCASSLDERVGRLTDDEDVDEKPSSSISMLRAAGSFVMSPSNPPPPPAEVAEELASFAFGGSLDFNEAMSSEMQDEPFYRDAFYRSPSRLEEALSAPLPPSPPGYTDSLLRPQLGDTTVDWPQVPLDQLVDVAITGPLALVACDDDVETVSGDVDVDFADP